MGTFQQNLTIERKTIPNLLNSKTEFKQKVFEDFRSTNQTSKHKPSELMKVNLSIKSFNLTNSQIEFEKIPEGRLMKAKQNIQLVSKNNLFLIENEILI